MEFETIDYTYLGTQSQLNDNFSNYMYDNSHSVFPNVTEKYNKIPEETIENHPMSHYDTNGFNNNGGFLSSEHEADALNCVSYQDTHNLYNDVAVNPTRMAMSLACNKIEDYSNQISSAECVKDISTGDSSTSFAHTLANTPCHEQSYNMNSPIENSTPTVSTPNIFTPDVSTPPVSTKSDNQNARRNMPVLFVQRVVKSFLDCFGSDFKGSYGRLDYVQSILRMRVPQKERPAFKEFLKSMDFGNKRTWSVITEKLDGKRPEFRDALLEGIDSFFGEAGSEDFSIWVNENKKMKGETKKILFESKGFFKDAFRTRYNGPTTAVEVFDFELAMNMNF